MTINIDKYSDLDLALMCCAGYLGNGTERRKRLGPRYLAVQLLVNQITRGTMPEPKGSITKDQIRSVLAAMKPTASEYDSFIEEVIKKL